MQNAVQEISLVIYESREEQVTGNKRQMMLCCSEQATVVCGQILVWEFFAGIGHHD